jgi:plastocyanin
MKAKRWSLALVMVLVAATLACGGGEAPPPEADQVPAQPEGVSGLAPAATQGIPSVVTLTPVGGPSPAPPAEPALLDQLSLSFMPNALMVHAGQTVQFKNSETLAHNVHVTFIDDESSVFMADMDPGATTHTVLEREGGYDVTCDVHPGMRAFLFVTSAPYATFAAIDGTFMIPDVPDGTYTVAVWSATPGLRSERQVDVSGTGTVLDLSPVS